MDSISVFGLGKVGLTLAGCLGAAGNKVVGYDPDADRVRAIAAKRLDVQEPGLAERLAQAPQFSATTDPAAAIRQTDLSFVIVPTPSNTLGGFSLRFVLSAMDQIGTALREKRGAHTVALVSTVLPGSSNRTIIPRLEAASQRRLGEGLGYCYNPVFIALGDVVKGFEVPDYLLIGQADPAAGEAVLQAHSTMLRNKAPVARMSPVEAEITKLASNTHETMRVAFANMLFCACSEIPGADVDRITEALTHRMGRRFFKGATPFGGPCWPRDNQALAAFMNVIGTPNGMPRAVDIFNAEHGRYILSTVLAATAPGDVVGVLGLSYKPGTSCIERAFGVDLAMWLVNEGRRVVAWDPLAMGEARHAMQGKIQFAQSAEDCLAASSLAVIVNPLADAERVNWSVAHRTVVVDCWRSLPTSAVERVGNYRPLGRGPREPISAWLGGQIGERLRILTE